MTNLYVQKGIVNYDNGTIKKVHKTWKYPKHYKKLKTKHAELCHINAINRQLAINEDANHLRSLGYVLITEPQNASKLMKRAKDTTVKTKVNIMGRGTWVNRLRISVHQGFKLLL